MMIASHESNATFYFTFVKEFYRYRKVKNGYFCHINVIFCNLRQRSFRRLVCLCYNLSVRAQQLEAVVHLARLLIALLVSRQHLIEKLVGHATSNKLLLRQNTIFVLVHLVEDLVRASLGRVSWIVVSQLWTNHVVNSLHTFIYRLHHTLSFLVYML